MQKSIGWSLVGAALLAWSQGAFSVEALARAALIRGGVSVSSSEASEPRKLKRNETVAVGETVRTGPKGLAQLIFPDRSMIYVKASSELRVEAFHFDTDHPERDRSVTTLLKGGMRALSGMVGKRSPATVTYNTRVSTIGIRGTAIDIFQGGPECLASGSVNGCGGDASEWTVTFDFGHGWVETEGGRVEVEEGQTVRFSRRQQPLFARLERRKNDPAMIARQFAQMEPNQIEAWAREQAFRMGKEDLFMALGMLNQTQRFTVDKLQGAVRGFSRAMSREERSEMREFTTRIYPRHGDKIMKSTTRNRDELSASLESVLRGMESASGAELKQVYETAVEMGITKEQAQEVMRNLQENPARCR